MIWAVSACAQCPFFGEDGVGRCGAAEGREVFSSDRGAGETSWCPPWCPLETGSIRVRELLTSASSASGKDAFAKLPVEVPRDDASGSFSGPPVCPSPDQPLCPPVAGRREVGVRVCRECPFSYETDIRRCTIATPKGRPLWDEAERPSWCILRKENGIVRKR